MTVSLATAATDTLRLPMRPCVGIALFNAQGRIWLGRREPRWARLKQSYIEGPIWQPPQGGIDRGERPRDAAVRELFEETGIARAEIVGEIPGWLSFELPRDLIGIALKGKFSGQRLRWFAMRFSGADDEITLKPKGRTKSEFDAWRWADLDELPALALPFKRPIYAKVAEQFAALAQGLPVAAE